MKRKDIVIAGHKCGKPTMSHIANQSRGRMIYRTKRGDIDSRVLFHILGDFMCTAAEQMEYSQRWADMHYAAGEIAIRLQKILEGMEENEL